MTQLPAASKVITPPAMVQTLELAKSIVILGVIAVDTAVLECLEATTGV
jgi:hypothetical protein